MTIREEIQNKAKEVALQHNLTGILDISPRVGKSKIAIESIKDVSSVAIIAPYNSIVDSWQKEYQKWGLNNIPVTLCTRSIDKLPDTDLIIVDEIQTLSDLQIKNLKGKRILGLTGTLGEDTKKKLKKELGLDVIYKYSYEQAIEDKIISDFRINVVLLPLDNIIKRYEHSKDGKIWFNTEKQEYDYLTKQFNRFKILSWNNSKLEPVKMKWAGQRSNLIYNSTSKYEVAKSIFDKLNRSVVFTTRTEIADKFADSYHSKSEEDNLERFQNGDIDKLAVCQMTNMGITLNKLDSLVVHQLQSNEEMSIQKIMRCCTFEYERPDKVSTIWITVYRDTVDEEWCNNALSGVSKGRIKYLDYRNL
jgi:superfamily II DNA or RNA helicase